MRLPAFLRRRRAEPPRPAPEESRTFTRPTTMRRERSFFGDLMQAPDQGATMYYEKERKRHHVATLVSSGRHAGQSAVRYEGHNIGLHLITQDFFITMLNLHILTIMGIASLVYLLSFFFFSIWYYLIVKYNTGCIYGATTYVECWTLSFVVQMTIGFGNTGPQNCWAASWVIVTQAIYGMMLEAVTIGIIFARISRPAQRGRSIFISDKAVIARRDGILKFMFRVADVRSTQVVEPKIAAWMYTWGNGRITAEGEKIPVRVEQLNIGYIDGMMLLPLIIEHTVDERSPLWGHNHGSLQELNTEIVITFEGTSEFGNPFMARRSYVPDEIRWGAQFADIICPPEGGGMQYKVNLEAFHDVHMQLGMPAMAPGPLSDLVVNRSKRTVPFPILGENTMALADSLCVAPNEHGQLCLTCRIGDTYPNQMVEINVMFFLYRWFEPQAPQPGEAPKAVLTQHQLEVGYQSGRDRLHLRLPVEVSHVIDDASPLAAWREAGGIAREDSFSEIIVVVNAHLHALVGETRLRQRTYTVGRHIKYGQAFVPIVKHPAFSRDRKPRTKWERFHDVAPVRDMGPYPSAAQAFEGLKALPQSASPLSAAAGLSLFSSSMDRDTAIPPQALAGGAPLAGMPRLPSMIERNDYTVAGVDLQRYAATVGNMDETLMKFAKSRRSPLPDFSAAANILGTLPPATMPAFMSYAATTMEADTLPHAAALHPALPSASAFRGPTRETEHLPEDENELTLTDLPRVSPSPAAADEAAEGGGGAEEAAEKEEAGEEEEGDSTVPASDAPSEPAEGSTDRERASGAAGASATSATALLGDQASVALEEGQQYELGQEESGPIHFDKAQRESWRSGRALARLFNTGGSGGAGEDPGEGGDAELGLKKEGQS